MDLMVIDGLLTVVTEPHAAGPAAWTQAALLAASLASEQEVPLWPSLAGTLEAAGWVVEASSQQTLALPLLTGSLRADPGLAVLLDRRGGIHLADEATALLETWWQRSLTASGPTNVVLLAGTLALDAKRHATAQLYAVTLPSPSWRWLVRTQLVQTRLNRLSLRLDEARHAALAPTLAERTRALAGQVRTVHLGAALRGA